MAKMTVPVPPLDVQNRIVNVLDNFEKICSDLNIGLPAEIEARQKQYEYYRDKLLTFAETGNTILNGTERNGTLIKLLQYVFGYAVVTLEDIAENCDSMRKPVTSGKREAGEYPYYGASGIVDYVKDYIFDGDYLLVSEDGANLLARSTPIAFSISGKNCNRQISRRIKKHLWLSNRSWARDVHSFGILHSWGALAGKSCSAQASSIWLIAGAFRRTQSK